jgi:GTPase SAR1 family protein
MEGSRSSTPEAPPQDLWSSILDSVSQSRSIPSKQILLLGQPNSGKSTLASALLQKPLSDDVPDAERSDFAMGYDWADVRDEGDEGNSICAYRCLLEAYYLENRYLSTTVRIHRTVSCICLYLSASRLSTTTLLFTTHSCGHRP